MHVAQQKKPNDSHLKNRYFISLTADSPHTSKKQLSESCCFFINKLISARFVRPDSCNPSDKSNKPSEKMTVKHKKHSLQDSKPELTA